VEDEAPADAETDSDNDANLRPEEEITIEFDDAVDRPGNGREQTDQREPDEHVLALAGMATGGTNLKALAAHVARLGPDQQKEFLFLLQRLDSSASSTPPPATIPSAPNAAPKDLHAPSPVPSAAGGSEMKRSTSMPHRHRHEASITARRRASGDPPLQQQQQQQRMVQKQGSAQFFVPFDEEDNNAPLRRVAQRQAVRPDVQQADRTFGK
jgi:hypothetical protein